MGAPPEGMSGPGALQELQVSRSYGGEPTVAVSLDFDNVDRISLPPPGSAPGMRLAIKL